jgi:hypothetical protein
MSDQTQDITPPPGAEPQQPGLRFLETTVYIMGGLLIIMLVVLIGGIIWKANHKTEAPPDVPKIFGAGIAPGTLIDEVTLNGDRLAIRAGGEVVVVDVKKGSIISRVRLFEQ